jgi:DNA-binding response OmpR family regulator
MRILLVEDDECISKPIEKVLGSQHYVVDVATDGQVAWELVKTFHYDLILLDVILPKLDGIELCQRLRANDYQTPILLLTGQNSSTAKVMGLDAGADDYVVKPFEFPELLARIRVLLRRNSSPILPVLECGNLRLDPGTCEVTYGEQMLHLTPKEYRLLELFLRNNNRVFNRGAILEHLWSCEEAPSEDTVTAHIKGLRQKLKIAGAPTDFIETVYGLGYRLKLPTAPNQKAASLSSKTKKTRIAQNTQVALAEVWEKVKGESSDRLIIIQKASKALRDGKLKEPQRQQALMAAHKLAGSLGVFGFAEASRLAKEIEQMLQPQITLDKAQKFQFWDRVGLLQLELQKPASWQINKSPSNQIKVMPAKIMAVDDDPQILAAMETLLQPWGLKLATLAEPLQFWTILAEFSPDLLILDLEMPHFSGIDLCQAIRNNPNWSSLPILFLTVHHEAEIVHQVFSAGADDFVSKPRVEQELVTRVINRLERVQTLRRSENLNHSSQASPYQAELKFSASHSSKTGANTR